MFIENNCSKCLEKEVNTVLSKADRGPPFRKPLLWWEAGEPAAPQTRAKGRARGRMLQMYRETHLT